MMVDGMANIERCNERRGHVADLKTALEAAERDLDHEAREHQVTHERWMQASDQLKGAVEDAADLVRLAHLPDKAMTQGDWLRLRELTRKYAPDHPASGGR